MLTFVAMVAATAAIADELFNRSRYRPQIRGKILLHFEEIFVNNASIRTNSFPKQFLKAIGKVSVRIDV